MNTEEKYLFNNFTVSSILLVEILFKNIIKGILERLNLKKLIYFQNAFGLLLILFLIFNK